MKEKDIEYKIEFAGPKSERICIELLIQENNLNYLTVESNEEATNTNRSFSFIKYDDGKYGLLVDPELLIEHGSNKI